MARFSPPKLAEYDAKFRYDVAAAIGRYLIISLLYCFDQRSFSIALSLLCL